MTASSPPGGERLARSRELFARRAARARRRPWLTATLALILVLAVGTFAYAVGFSSLFDVRTVTITGVSEQEAAAVRDAAQVPMNRPLIRVDTAAISDRILKARPPVKSALVTRQYPHTITITIVLRTPALVLRNSQGQLDLVDETGFAFQRVTAAPSGVPVVTTSGAAPGRTALTAAMAAVQAFPAARRSGISNIQVSGASSVTFTLDRTVVVWGTEGDAAKKERLVEVLIAQSPVPTRIDVSAPDAPVSR